MSAEDDVRAEFAKLRELEDRLAILHKIACLPSCNFCHEKAGTCRLCQEFGQQDHPDYDNPQPGDEYHGQYDPDHPEDVYRAIEESS